MSKLQHTQGPWEIVKFGDAYEIRTDEYDVVTASLRKVIRKESDARLIAAAPEMLEVLIRNYEDVLRLNRILIEDCKHPLTIMEGEIKNIVEQATGLSIQEVLEIVSTRCANAISEVASNGI